MSMDLTPKNYSTAPEYFLAGNCLMDVAKAVKTASVDIPAHAPVVLDSNGKLALITVTVGGTEEAPTYTVNKAGLYGLTPDSIRADEEGPVWLTGEYFADSLELPEGVTAADIETDLRELGIFLKKFD